MLYWWAWKALSFASFTKAKRPQPLRFRGAIYFEIKTAIDFEIKTAIYFEIKTARALDGKH